MRGDHGAAWTSLPACREASLFSVDFNRLAYSRSHPVFGNAGMLVMQSILCKVCYRPGPDAICSRRCHGLFKIKVALDSAEVFAKILEELSLLDRNVTICPGRLAKTVLDRMGFSLKEERDALSVLRESLFALREQGRLRFFQKNILVPKGKGPWDVRGPFRVRL